MNSWFTISLGLLVQQHITNSLFNQVIYTVQHTSPFPQGHHVKRVYSYRGVRPREKLKDPVIRGGISPTITACLCTWRHVRVRVARKRKSIFAPLFMLFQFYFSLFAYVFICAFTFFFEFWYCVGSARNPHVKVVYMTSHARQFWLSVRSFVLLSLFHSIFSISVLELQLSEECRFWN